MPEAGSARPVLLHRTILLRRPRAGVVVAWLEDQFHHFGLTLEHGDGSVRAVRSRVIRLPWTTCAAAGGLLSVLEGHGLIGRPSQLSRRLPISDHCTHLFELAALAMATGARGPAERRYDAIVTGEAERVAGRPRRLEARLEADGRRVMDWRLEDDVISAPAPAAGRSLTRGFQAWLDELVDEEAEHAWLLRRAAWLSLGSLRHGSVRYASQMGIGPVCHTFKPEQRDRAEAIPASYRPYDLEGPPRLRRALEEP